MGYNSVPELKTGNLDISDTLLKIGNLQAIRERNELAKGNLDVARGNLALGNERLQHEQEKSGREQRQSAYGLLDKIIRAAEENPGQEDDVWKIGLTMAEDMYGEETLVKMKIPLHWDNGGKEWATNTRKTFEVIERLENDPQSPAGKIIKDLEMLPLDHPNRKDLQDALNEEIRKREPKLYETEEGWLPASKAEGKMKPEKAKVTWSAPYSDEKGNMVQKSSTGQIKVLDRAGDKITWSEPYEDENGNTVQESSAGQIKTLNKASERAVKSWTTPKGEVVHLPNNQKPPKGSKPYSEAGALEDRMTRRQELISIRQDKASLKREISQIRGLPDLDVYKPQRERLPLLEDELRELGEREQELLGKKENTSEDLPEGLDEETVEFNMEKYGVTRQQVIDQYKTKFGGK